MKIKVDATKCAGIGLCEFNAPNVFEVGADGLSRVIDEDPPEEERAAVEEAVMACPTAALSITS